MASSSSSSSILLSQSEKDFIVAGCRDNCRLDGRQREEFGMYIILTGANAVGVTGAGAATSAAAAASPLVFSNGSARILSAATAGAATNHVNVICSVKADVVQPAPAAPSAGVVVFHLEDAASTNKQLLDWWQNMLQHLLLQQAVDTSKLCIVPHHYVWRLSIDVWIGSDTTAMARGGLVEAASHVIRAALLDTRLPEVSVVEQQQSQMITTTDPTSSSTTNNQQPTLVVNGDYAASYTPVGAAQAPCIVTVTVLKTTTTTRRQAQFLLILDATVEEEACAHAQVFVSLQQQQSKEVVSNQGVTVCGVRCQTTGAASLPMALLPDCVALAVQAFQDGRIHQAYRLHHTPDAQKDGPFLPPVYRVQC